MDQEQAYYMLDQPDTAACVGLHVPGILYDYNLRARELRVSIAESMRENPREREERAVHALDFTSNGKKRVSKIPRVSLGKGIASYILVATHGAPTASFFVFALFSGGFRAPRGHKRARVRRARRLAADNDACCSIMCDACRQ